MSMMSSVGVSKSRVRRWSGQVPWCNFATSWPACFGDRGRCVSEECREPFVREGGAAGRNVAGQVRAMNDAGKPACQGRALSTTFRRRDHDRSHRSDQTRKKTADQETHQSKQTVLTYIPCRLRGVLGGWWDVGRKVGNPALARGCGSGCGRGRR